MGCLTPLEGLRVRRARSALWAGVGHADYSRFEVLEGGQVRGASMG
jgi:hypothetical protein